MNKRPLQDGPHLEEVGEGWLSLGRDGQGLEIFRDDPVAKLNAPGRKDKVDTAHLSRLGDTDFVQWYGRKSDGAASGPSVEFCDLRTMAKDFSQ